MKPQKIFIEVAVGRDLPENADKFLPDWLKPIPEAYVFTTREELEAFAKDVIRLSREMQSVSWNERDYKYNLQTLFNQLVK